MPASGMAKAVLPVARRKGMKRRKQRRIAEEKEKYDRGFPVAGHDEYEQGR